MKLLAIEQLSVLIPSYIDPVRLVLFFCLVILKMCIGYTETDLLLLLLYYRQDPLTSEPPIICVIFFDGNPMVSSISFKYSFREN